MREVAQRAGVATSTVSRVVAGHPDVSDEMRRRVRAAIEELGYRPHLLAQSLRSRETRSVGFVAGDISNAVVAHIVKGAETTLQHAGYSMLLTNSLVDPEMDRRHIELLSQRRVDALVALLVNEDHEPTLAALERLTVPLVVIERDLPERVLGSRVLSDHRVGMSAAADHLLDLGHRRIALIVGQPVRPSRERLHALEEAFRRRGLPPGVIVRDGLYSVEHGARAMRELLATADPPSAVVAGGNQLMVGALHAIAEHGLVLGRDISFVGCDDLPVAELYRVPIALVDRDTVALGRAAAELVLAGLADGEPKEVRLPTSFRPAASCGPAPEMVAANGSGNVTTS